MSTHPRVSIGLPVYNGEAFLKESLDSLISQTFTDFELIICDNASTDATEQICREYALKDSRIVYIRNPINLGAAPNYNQTFALSKGAYFKWAADDDICDPRLLARCVDLLDQDPTTVLAYPSTVFVKPDGSRWWAYEPLPSLNAEHPHERFRSAISNFWCVEVFGLIRRETLAQTDLIASYYGSDKLLLAQLSLLGRLRLVPGEDPLFFRRCHSRQSSRLSPEARTAWIDSQSAGRSQWLRPHNSVELLKSLFKLPLDWPERLLCLSALQQKMLMRLPKDLARYFKQRLPTTDL